MPLQPRKEIARLEAGVHGGLDFAELKALGIDPDKVLDFSVCTNPFMPSPGLKQALAAAAFERYPDSGCGELRERLAAGLEISSDNILAGSGTTELIRLAALAYLRRGDAVVILEPTYGEYELASRIHGARIVRYRALEPGGFMPDAAEVAALIRRHKPRAVFICNPNNPTGGYLSRRQVEAILEACEDTLLVLDEAYIAFVGTKWNAIGLISRGNVAVLRSMTKDYNLPGLRLGYAVASREIIDTLRRVCPPWNVNAIAQQAGLAVLAGGDYLDRSLKKTAEARDYLAGGLARLGLEVLPASANFFLAKAGSAAELRGSLLKQGILVRDCTSFGLPAYVRISPRGIPDCEKLVKAIEGLLK